MDKIINHISYSEYKAFLSCEHRHFLTKVLGIQDTPNEYLVFGSALHYSIEEIVQKKSPKLMWGNIFKRQLVNASKNFALNSFQKSQFEKQGSEILNDLDFFNRYKGYEVFKVEEDIYSILYEDDKYQLYFKGFVDLILKKGDEILVLDWKSANKPWSITSKYGVVEKEKGVYVFPPEITIDSDEKGFFGQVALYKHFICEKYGFLPENVKTAYVALPRTGGYPQQYNVEVGPQYMNFILQDIASVAINIIEVNPNKLNKSSNKKKDCYFCMFKGTNYCNEEEHQIVKKND